MEWKFEALKIFLGITMHIPNSPPPSQPICQLKPLTQLICQLKPSTQPICQLKRPSQPIRQLKSPSQPIRQLRTPSQPICQLKSPTQWICQLLSLTSPHSANICQLKKIPTSQNQFITHSKMSVCCFLKGGS